MTEQQIKTRNKKVQEICNQKGYNSAEYIVDTDSVTYICKCEIKNTISYDGFIRPSKGGCKSCRNKMTFTLEYVKEIFEKNGCKLLSTEYINSNQHLEYECSCGNNSVIKLKEFQKGSKCKRCGYDKRTRPKNGMSVAEMHIFLKEKGCKGFRKLKKAELNELVKEYQEK